MVRAIHERVVTARCPTARRTPPPTRTCSTWVHVAEIDSFLLAAPALRRAGRSTRPGATSTSRRRRSSPGKLGVVDPPTTEAELDAAVASVPARARAPPTTRREAVSYLIWHPDLPLAARPPYGVLVAAAIGLMPRVDAASRSALPMAAAGARPGRRRPRPGRHPHDPLGDGQRPRAHCPPPRADRRRCERGRSDGAKRRRTTATNGEARSRANRLEVTATTSPFTIGA